MSTDDTPGCCVERSSANSNPSAANVWDKPAMSTIPSEGWGNVGGDIWSSSGRPGDEAWRTGGVAPTATWTMTGKDDGWESSEKIGGDGFGGNRWGNIGRVVGGSTGNEAWGSNESWGAGPNSTWGGKEEGWGNTGGCDVWGSSSNVGGVKWGSVGKDGDSWGNDTSSETLVGCSKAVGDTWGPTSTTSRSGIWGIAQSEDSEWGNVSKQAWSNVRRHDDEPAKESEDDNKEKDKP